MTAQECHKEVMLAKQALANLQEEYELQVGDVEITQLGTVQMIAKSARAGVRISCSPRDGIGLDVIVGRLLGGEFPPHPGTIDDDTILDRFDLRDLASLRVDRVTDPLRRKIESDARLSVEDVMMLLEECSSDVLRGDFSVFDDASTIVKQRARRLSEEYPIKND